MLRAWVMYVFACADQDQGNCTGEWEDKHSCWDTVVPITGCQRCCSSCLVRDSGRAVCQLARAQKFL